MSEPNPTLIHVLTSCLSPDSAVRAPAESTLGATVAQAQGITIQLLDVILAAATVPPQVRALAATCFKNCVAKRWKRVQTHAFAPAEKSQARVRCASCLFIPEPHIFRVVVATMAKMLRADWSADEWPDLLPNIVALASSADASSARRGMQALHAIVKELSTISLFSEKQRFTATSPHIAAVAAPAWQQLLPLVPSSAEAAESARTVAKIYKHALMRNAALAVPGGAVFSFFESCCQVVSFTSDICSGRTASAIHEQIIALTRTLFACMRACIKALPVQCSLILPNLAGACVQILVSCNTAHAVNDSAASLTCCAMSVLETIFYENIYKQGSVSRVTNDPVAKQQAEAAFGSFFTETTIGQLVELLACSYCNLSPAQLARWEESPEAFSNECDAQCDLLPSGRAVRIIMQLAHRLPVAVGACILELLKKVGAAISSCTDAGDSANIILCDAILGCVHEISHDIKGETSTLLTGVDRSLFFRSLFHALGHADAAIALAASSAIVQAMDGMDISTGKDDLVAFLPVLPGVIEQLTKLLPAFEEEDSKTRILHAICVTIGHAGPAAAPMASSLIAAFPQIWEVTRHFPTTQPKCLMLLTSLINCAREGVAPHLPALCSVIAFTVNVKDPSALTTREYALDTCLAALRCVSAYTEDLHKLFEHLLPLLTEDHCEHVKCTTCIIDSFVLLGGATFASVYAAAVLQGLVRMLPHVKEQGKVLICQSIHVMFVAVPGVVGTEAAGAACAAIATEAVSPTTYPSSILATSYYGVLARYCFVNTGNFIALCRHLGDGALNSLMDAMFISMDQAPPPISCLMLASSLQVLASLASAGARPDSLHSLAHGALNAGVNSNSIFASNRSASNHLYALTDSLMKTFGMYVAESDTGDDGYVPPDALRKRALASGDPVASATPKAVLVQAIQSMQTSLPPGVFQDVMAGVDPDILKQAIAITQQT